VQSVKRKSTPNIVLLAKELDGFFVTSPEAMGKLSHDLMHYNMVHDNLIHYKMTLMDNLKNLP
jgi:hypothetical protein